MSNEEATTEESTTRIATQEEERWDDEGRDFFIRIAAYLILSFVFQGLSFILLRMTTKNYDMVAKLEEEKMKTAIEEKPEKPKQSPVETKIKPRLTPIRRAKRGKLRFQEERVFRGKDRRYRRRLGSPPAPIADPRQGTSTVTKTTTESSTVGSTVPPPPPPKPEVAKPIKKQKKKEDDVKFNDKGTVLMTSHNITQAAVMDGDFTPEKRITLKKVSFDPKLFLSYEVGNGVDQFEESIDRGGSAGSGGSILTASIKQLSMKKF